MQFFSTYKVSLKYHLFYKAIILASQGKVLFFFFFAPTVFYGVVLITLVLTLGLHVTLPKGTCYTFVFFKNTPNSGRDQQHIGLEIRYSVNKCGLMAG